MKNRGKFLLILGVLLVVADQIIKVMVKTNMTLGESIPVLGQWFQLVFVENKGMAFGMAFGGVIGKYALTAFRIILFGGLTWWISKLLKRDPQVPTGVIVGLTLITAGALGNIIDCLFYGLIFTESGTYAVVYDNGKINVGSWSWENSEDGSLKCEWSTQYQSFFKDYRFQGSLVVDVEDGDPATCTIIRSFESTMEKYHLFTGTSYHSLKTTLTYYLKEYTD